MSTAAFIADENLWVQTSLARKEGMRRRHFKCDVAISIRAYLRLVWQCDNPSIVYLTDGERDSLVQIIISHPRTVLHWG